MIVITVFMMLNTAEDNLQRKGFQLDRFMSQEILLHRHLFNHDDENDDEEGDDDDDDNDDDDDDDNDVDDIDDLSSSWTHDDHCSFA